MRGYKRDPARSKSLRLLSVFFIGLVFVAFSQPKYIVIDLGSIPGSIGMSTARSGNNLNSDGDVVGSAFMANNANHVFIYDDGKLKDLGTLNGLFTGATGINDSGHVVGCGFVNGGSTYQAFLYSGKTMTPLGKLLWGQRQCGQRYQRTRPSSWVGSNSRYCLSCITLF